MSRFDSLKNSIDRKIPRISEIAGTDTGLKNFLSGQSIEKFSTNIKQGVQDSVSATVSEVTKKIGSNTNNLFGGAIPQSVKNISGFPGSITPPSGPGSSYKQFQPGQEPPWNNELEPYASYNSIFTLSTLTIEELNNPDETYVTNSPKNIIIKSGGLAGSEKVKTSYEKNGGSSIEYYMDNIEIESFIAPNPTTGIANAVGIEFDVFEPYSLGMFIQALKNGAQQSGYSNYIECPFLLTVEFKGWNEENESELSPYATRRIPIKLVNVTVSASEGGSEYRVQGYAFNGQAFLNETQTLVNDVSITGKDLIEILQTGGGSLAAKINETFKGYEDTKQSSTADRIIIQFPDELTSGNNEHSTVTTQRATITENQNQQISSYIKSQTTIDEFQGPRDVLALQSYQNDFSEFQNLYNSSEIAQRKATEARSNVSKMGKEKIITGFEHAGEMPYALPDATWDPVKKVYLRYNLDMQISQDNRKYTFTSGSKIEHIIQQMILISTFAKTAKEQFRNLPSDGMITWYRIESQVYMVRDAVQEARSGRIPKVFVYRVVPYKIHHSFFTGANRDSQGMTFLKSQAAKEYNYIYTGQNKDVLDFKLEFNLAFYVALESNSFNANADSKVEIGNNAIQTQKEKYKTQEAGSTQSDDAQPISRTVNNQESNSSTATGNAYDTAEDRNARQINDAFLNSAVDLLEVDLTILGDPFYLPNSGLGNYVAEDSGHFNMKTDGSINYQNGDVFVNLLFRTPIDYNDNGTMDFAQTRIENSEVIDGFSGIYKVILIKHSFSKGQFTQELKLLRYRNQTDSQIPVPPVIEETDDPSADIQTTSNGGYTNGEKYSGL